MQIDMAGLTGSAPGALLAQTDNLFQMFPDQRSTLAADVDWLFYFILWTCFVFWLIIVGCMVWFAYRYRRRPGVEPEPSPHHNTPLEVTWSVLPGFLLALMFYWGFTGYIDMRTPPAKAYEINVTGQKWVWNFQYPNGHIDSDLYVPANTPVRLVMSSTDVLHSLSIPAFRVKQDVVPGRYTELWFEATEPGEYQLFCTEYCGTDHSNMLSKVHVIAEDEFPAKLAEVSDIVKRFPIPWQAGAVLYLKRGCGSCHSVDGRDLDAGMKGPSFLRNYGQRRDFTDGTALEADENYVRQSILEPQAKIRRGYQPVMPTFQGLLKEPEINVIIAFLKQLQDPNDAELEEINAFLADPKPPEPEAEETADETTTE